MKNPIYKHQNTNKSQIPITNAPNKFGIILLGDLNSCLEF
jgi:hypothetical protein